MSREGFKEQGGIQGAGRDSRSRDSRSREGFKEQEGIQGAGIPGAGRDSDLTVRCQICSNLFTSNQMKKLQNIQHILKRQL